MSKNFEVIFKEFADSDTFVLSRGLLEDYKRQAAQDERERIIKLLEEEYEWFTSIEAGKLYNPIPEIVDLIKGENK